MFVACSTLCFGRHSLEETLNTIAELRFSKFDVAIHEHGGHLRPSEVAADVAAAAARLRYGPGLAPVAFSVEIDAADEAEHDRQFQAVCRLARVSAVPLLTLPPAGLDTPADVEVKRLNRLLRIADREGILLTVATRMGAHTETADGAVALCEQAPGLGLTLDPSHYTVGAQQGKSYDGVFPYVRHVHLRDTGRNAHQFQVRVGQGEIEYGRIVSQLARYRYERALTVDIRETPDAPFPMEPEVRKLKYLLESLV